MLPRLLVWDNGCTYSQTREALEEAYICEEESRRSLIRMGKKSWQKRLRKRREVKKQDVLSQYPGKRVIRKRGVYMGSECYKTLSAEELIEYVKEERVSTNVSFLLNSKLYVTNKRCLLQGCSQSGVPDIPTKLTN